MVFGAKFSCNQPTVPTMSFVGTNLLQDCNDKVSRDAENFMRHDMTHNWKHGHIPPPNSFDLFYFRNPVLRCVVQDRFQIQSASRTTFLQKGENDEDMTLMYMTTVGVWNGVEEVQQGCPIQRGGTRLIWFESPRWTPKAI
jgi:hypothetical protein